jgi:hypothetical protein
LFFSALTTTSATALDCSNLKTLVCEVPPTQYSLWLWGADHNGNFCGTGAYVGAHVQAFTFSFDEPQEVTLTLTGPAARYCDFFLLAECAEISCLDRVVGNQEEKIIEACLASGEYYVALATFIEAVLPYELGLACEPCVPILGDKASWSSLKYLYR